MRIKSYVFAALGVLGAFVSSTALAGNVNPDAPAPNWLQIKPSDRLNYATRASIMCQSQNCVGLSLKACMDEVARPPVPDALQNMTIGELAIGCIKMLKVRE